MEVPGHVGRGLFFLLFVLVFDMILAVAAIANSASTLAGQICIGIELFVQLVLGCGVVLVAMDTVQWKAGRQWAALAANRFCLLLVFAYMLLTGLYMERIFDAGKARNSAYWSNNMAALVGVQKLVGALVWLVYWRTLVRLADPKLYSA